MDTQTRPIQAGVAIYALFCASCLTLAQGIPRPVSFVCFAAVFAGILVWIWRTEGFTITVHPTILAGVALVWLTLGIGFLRGPSFDGLLRLGAFVGVSGILLFVFPSTFTARDLYRPIAWVAAAIVIVGLPVAVVGPLGPLGVWRSEMLLGVQYSIPLSIFDNPNALGAVAAMGAVAAAGEVLSDRSSIQVLGEKTHFYDALVAEALVGICAIGVVLSTGRGALLSLLAGIGTLVVCHAFRRTVATSITALGVVAFTGAIAIAAGFLPGPEVFQSIDLSGRGVLWHAVVEAVGERPVFGFGPGAGEDDLAQFVPEESRYRGGAPHSSYFRMFFIGGLVGGLGYLLLTVSALRAALSEATPRGATTAAMLVAVFLMLIFNGATIFGLHPLSVVGALMVGFAQLSARKTRSVRLSRDALPAEINAAIERSKLLAAAEDSVLLGAMADWRKN